MPIPDATDFWRARIRPLLIRGRILLRVYVKPWLKHYLPWKRVALVFAIFSLVLVFWVLWVIRDLPTAETLAERVIAQSTILYDRTGATPLYDIHGSEKRRVVGLEDISPYLIDATVVIEDDQFYSHSGLDIPGIIRSVFVDIKEGRLAQGGSTITQQLVRQAVLSTEKTFTRKIREAVLAIAVEVRFSKDEILEGYLNQIPYGSLIYGAEAASQTYFGKSAKDLALAEAATLAALPQAPSYYSPYGDNREDLFSRKDLILDRMHVLGYITAEERDQAKATTPDILPVQNSIRAPHFVFYVREELERRFGKDRVEAGGLRVVTSLDLPLQEIAERAVREGAARNLARYQAQNAALVALDPKTGEVLTMVGSKDYFDETIDGNVNVVVRPNQPGSSFKPVVYAAAFEEGYTTETVLFDLPTDFGANSGRPYAPQNYTGRHHGPVTARQALANSLNVPAVKMLYLVGVRDAVAFANRLGIASLNDPDRYGLSLVLGGGDVTLLEETSAFGVFAADGMRAAPEVLLRVEEADGTVLYEHNADPERVVEKEITRQITDVLSDNASRALIFGTNSPLVLPGRTAAAKTGTTQYFNDAWTVGYTPSLVAGVWVGNNDNSAMRTGADGSIVAAPIWNQFMREALAETSAESFPSPAPVEVDKPVLRGDWGYRTVVKVDRASGKLATEQTPPEWVEERAYGSVHDTLHWLDRNDPQGPIPSDPSRDPQYTEWERAVRVWAAGSPEAQVISNASPPTEEDDIHVPENEPELRVLLPSRNDLLEGSFTISTAASAPLGLQSVTFSLEDLAFGTLAPEPGAEGLFLRTVSLPETLPGAETTLRSRTLEVRAFDRYGNRKIVRIQVRVREMVEPDVSDDVGSSQSESL